MSDPANRFRPLAAALLLAALLFSGCGNSYLSPAIHTISTT